MVNSPRAILATIAAGLAMLSSSAVLGQEIYSCTDANGKVEFKNTGETKGCKKLSIDPVVVPRLGNNSAPSTLGANYPKVDPATQKSRDTDRRKILEDELATQKVKMAQLQKDYNNGEPDRTGDERNYQRYLDRVQSMKDSLARTQSDIDSIQGELSKLP